jgi:hypothetical protein
MSMGSPLQLWRSRSIPDGVEVHAFSRRAEDLAMNDAVRYRVRVHEYVPDIPQLKELPTEMSCHAAVQFLHAAL